MAEDIVNSSTAGFPNNIVAGDDDIIADRFTLKAAQGAIAAYTPLKVDSASSYQLVPAAIGDGATIVGILAPTNGIGDIAAAGVANSASTQEIKVIRGGAFFKSILPAAITALNKNQLNYVFAQNTRLRFVEPKAGQD